MADRLNISLVPGAFNEGAYGTVYFDVENGIATKIFLAKYKFDHSHAVFQSEVGAYELAMANPSVSRLVPKFYGRVEIGSVKDHGGNDISEKYFLPLAYQMELLPGPFYKMSSPLVRNGNQIQSIFIAAGIYHIIDASASIDESGQVLKVIDFALQEHELWHDDNF